MKYRLIALDLDGTVVNREGALVAGSKEAVQRALATGLTVTIATGRMYQPSNRFAAELDISAPLICHQGALVREPGDGATLWHMPLPASLARRLIAGIREEGVHQYCFIDGAIYVEERREADLLYAQQNGVELRLVDNLAMLSERQPTEIAARGEAKEIDRLVARMRVDFGSEVMVNKVHSSFCEIVHAEAGKGNALKYLAARLGIPQSQTVAIGDSPNDVSMLEWAGLGIAVGDASAEVRASADWVFDHGAEESFREAIAQLLNHSGL